MSATMPRKVLILNGNPSKASLCAALAETMAETARQGGALVRLRHLQDMNFDIDLTEGYRLRKELEPDLVSFQSDLTWCDTLLLVHPLWWGGPPAKLKGLFDRVLLPGFAFDYQEGHALPAKLLTGRTSRVLITADTPPLFLWLLYSNAWPRVLRNQILNFVGLRVTRLVTLGPIRGTDQPRDKERWFAAARSLAS